MPPPSFIATVVLAAVVLVLAIARIRSQRKISNAAKTYQQSQRKLNRTLDDLSDAVRNSAGSNSSLATEASTLAAKSARPESTADAPHRTPQPHSAGKCPYCGHSAQLASFAVAPDPDP